MFNDTELNIDAGFINLSGQNITGNFTSVVFDAGVDTVWDNINWSEVLPTDGETVPNGNTVLLFHLNNDSNYGENDTFVFDFSSNGNNGTAVNTIPTPSGKVDVVIDYALKDLMNNILVKAHETVGVETKVGFLRSLTVPKEASSGNHTFFVNITYKDTSTTGEDYFMVKSRISYIPSVIQKRLVEILVWVFGVALLFTLYFLVRSRYKEKYLEKKEKSDIQRLQRQMKKLKKEG